MNASYANKTLDYYLKFLLIYFKVSTFIKKQIKKNIVSSINDINGFLK